MTVSILYRRRRFRRRVSPVNLKKKNIYLFCRCCCCPPQTPPAAASTNKINVLFFGFGLDRGRSAATPHRTKPDGDVSNAGQKCVERRTNCVERRTKVYRTPEQKLQVRPSLLNNKIETLICFIIKDMDPWIHESISPCTPSP